MKPESKSRAYRLCVLFLCVCMALCLIIGGAFAQYMTKVSGDDAVSVAKWSIKINDEEIAKLDGDGTFTLNLFDTVKDTGGIEDEIDVAVGMIAPGTCGSFDIEVRNESEVNSKYSMNFSVENAENIPLQFAINDGEWKDSIGDISIVDMPLNMEEEATVTTVKWQWPYDLDSDNADTLLGILAQDGAVSINVICDATFTQIDDPVPNDGDEDDDKPPHIAIPTIAAGDSWYKGTTSIATITKIEFVTELPEATFSEQWDASEAGDGSITAAISGTKLYISSNGAEKIMANENSSHMFGGDSLINRWTSLTTIDKIDMLDTSAVTDMSGMFYGCETLTAPDLSSWDTSKVTNMSNMFYGCAAVTSLETVSNWKTGNVENMESMFLGCNSLTMLDLSNWDTGAVTDMNYMFYFCNSLDTLDLSSWNTSMVTDMSHMYHGCKKLTKLNVSGWNVGAVTDMSRMFESCSTLTTVSGISDWNTGTVEDMNRMFYGCEALAELDLSGWDTSKVTNMSYMFYSCKALAMLNLSSWDTSAVTDMSYMFYDCDTLTAMNLSDWDTRKVTNMNRIFSYCKNLASVDLTGWNTESTGDTGFMFNGCYKLQEIKVGSGMSASALSQLPTPSSSDISGADGKWYAKSNKQGYAPASLPGNKADTYYASKNLLPA